MRPESAQAYRRPQKVGYRKTAVKVEHRRTPDVMPDWKLVLQLPTNVAFGLAPGPVPGVPHVTMISGGRAEIVGKNKQWCCDQAAAFIKKVANGYPGGRIQATMTREGEGPSHTLSGPRDAGDRLSGEIVFMTGYPAVLIDGLAMRPMFYEGK